MMMSDIDKGPAGDNDVRQGQDSSQGDLGRSLPPASSAPKELDESADMAAPISTLVSEAKTALNLKKYLEAKQAATNAYTLACQAKDKYENGDSVFSPQLLAEWFGTCALVLNQVGSPGLAIRSYYTSSVYDVNWTEDRHREMASSVWPEFVQHLSLLPQTQTEILDTLVFLDQLADLAEKRCGWLVCLAVSYDVIMHYSRFCAGEGAVETSLYFRGVLRMARCYFHLGPAGDNDVLQGQDSSQGDLGRSLPPASSAPKELDESADMAAPISTLVSEAKTALDSKKYREAKEAATNAYTLACQAKDKYENGDSVFLPQLLAEWFGTCALVLNQVGSPGLAIRSYYTSSVYDVNWTEDRHREMASSVWTEFVQHLSLLPQTQTEILDTLVFLDQLADLAEKRCGWLVCLAVSYDVIMHYSRFCAGEGAVETSLYFRGVLRMARCYFHLGIHVEVQRLCDIERTIETAEDEKNLDVLDLADTPTIKCECLGSSVLNHEVNNTEALELVTRSLKENGYLHESSKNTTDKDRLQVLGSELKKETQVPESTEADSAWLKGTNVNKATARDSRQRNGEQKKNHMGPKARERMPSCLESLCGSPSPKRMLKTSIAMDDDDFEESDDYNDNKTFFESSLSYYNTRTEGGPDGDLTADISLLRNGLNLSEEYLKRFEDRRPEIKKRPPFYEEMKSEEELNKLSLEKPRSHKRCLLHIEGSHKATCQPIQLNDEVSDIEISGRSKAGQTFNDDEVLVELLDNEQTHKNDKRFGKVLGVLKRHRHRKTRNPVFVCTLDDMESHLVRPLCKTIPKLHIINKEIMDTCPGQKKTKVELYRYDERNQSLEFHRIENIDPARREKYVFLVVYINWSRQYIYPRAAVIKKLPCGNTLKKGLRILDLQWQVPTMYSQPAVRQVESIMLRQTNGEPSKPMIKDRTDLSAMDVFTIDPAGSKDLDDALSISKTKGLFRVGIHIADVSAYVKKDDSIDQESRERAVTFYPQGLSRPRHMIPEPFSEGFLSLQPNKKRLALSLFVNIDEQGHVKDCEVPRKTVIVSKQRFTYKEAQNIIDGCTSGPFGQDIKDLHWLARKIRKRRLGNSMHSLQLDVDEQSEEDSFPESVEAHYLVEEFMVLANSRIAKLLRHHFPSCTPVRCQPPPSKEALQAWQRNHGEVIDVLLSLQDKVIPECKTPSFSTQGLSDSSKKVMIQKWVWKSIDKGEEKHADLVRMDELHPLQCVAYQEWISLQEPAEYRCSGTLKTQEKDGHHFSLNKCPYTHFTSPIRRYVDLVVHRLIHALLDDKKDPPYHAAEVADICSHVNAVTKRSKAYQKGCKALFVAVKLRSDPKIFSCFVEDVSESSVSFCIPELQYVSQTLREMPFNLLDLGFKPEIVPDAITNRGKVVVNWRKRIYNTTGIHPHPMPWQPQTQRVDPHQGVVFVSLRDWMEMLSSAIERRPVGRQVSPINVSSGTVKDVSTESMNYGSKIQPNTRFSMTYGIGQVLKIQLTAEPQKGILVVKPQLYDMTSNLKCCLQHTDDPVFHLSHYSNSPTLDKYINCNAYLKRWLPLVDMEAATGAVRNEESCIINGVSVKFSDDGGKFILLETFCETRNILFGGNRSPEEDEDENPDETAYDWLCIKYEAGQTENRGSFVWIAHASVTKVKRNVKKRQLPKTKEQQSIPKVTVHFEFHCPHPAFPSGMIDQERVVCCVELLVKSEVDRRTESFLKKLPTSSRLAKAVALNNRIDSLDNDHWSIGANIELEIDVRTTRTGQQQSNEHVRPLPRNNAKQTEAIHKALLSRFSLIQGPPGTGKTYTGIKLMYLFDQINKAYVKDGNNKKQVMFCGPSNKSVDLVTRWMKSRLGDKCPNLLRMYGQSIVAKDYPVPGRSFLSKRSTRNSKADETLAEVTLHQLIREPGNSFSKEINDYDRRFKQSKYEADPEDVKKYISLIRKASIEEMQHHDIILCTTAVASNAMVLKGTKIFQLIIDESGMCPEPHCLTPIIATKAEQVVLIGDHKQLRPFVTCKQAAELGLEKSMFERYALSKIAFSLPFTLLDTQYRMNPKLCRFPSNQFYEGKLQTGEWGLWQEGSQLRLWQNAPHVFCHIEGEEKILTVSTEEGNEQSRSNEEEVKKVVEIIQHIVRHEYVTGLKRQVNVISQYNAQCYELRRALERERLNNFNVNTVVSSQGGEWDYVIFSTVRSLPDYKIEQNPTIGWCKQNLGFITDQNQINVALTRARKGIIIVGNKNLLRCDEVWRNLLAEYDRLGCVKTADEFPPRRISRKSELRAGQRRAPQHQNSGEWQLVQRH